MVRRRRILLPPSRRKILLGSRLLIVLSLLLPLELGRSREVFLKALLLQLELLEARRRGACASKFLFRSLAVTLIDCLMALLPFRVCGSFYFSLCYNITAAISPNYRLVLFICFNQYFVFMFKV